MIRPGTLLTITHHAGGGSTVHSPEPGTSHCTARATRIATSLCVRCRKEIGIGRVYVEVSSALHPQGCYHHECVGV